MYLLIRKSDNAVLGCQYTTFGRIDNDACYEVADYEGDPLPIHAPDDFFHPAVSYYTPKVGGSVDDRVAVLEKQIGKLCETLGVKLEV